MLRDDLEALLSHDVSATRLRERHEFDQISKGRPIVLMGAGGLGRRALAGLRLHGVEPLAFADNAVFGTSVDGVPVLSPSAAAEQFGDSAAFVVTIWGANRPHRFEHSRQQLIDLGCDVVCPFPPLFWKYPDALLPFYLQDLPSKVIEQRSAVLHGFGVWEDETSRAEYVAQVRLRLLADFDGLAHPVTHAQYFPDDLFAWSGDEWIVDGGAYDGDTVRTVSDRYSQGFGHMLSLEPDPTNFERLKATVAALRPTLRGKVDIRQIALSSERALLHLDATGTAASTTRATPSSRSTPVQAETLDALVGDKRVTVIKLDIEGFEIDALEGGRRTIQRDSPVLAICVYHRQDHLWKIPSLLHSWLHDHAFFLRPHNEEGWDLVCYSVPRRRLKA